MLPGTVLLLIGLNRHLTITGRVPLPVLDWLHTYCFDFEHILVQSDSRRINSIERMKGQVRPADWWPVARVMAIAADRLIVCAAGEDS